MRMMALMIPMTVKTPVSSGLFFKKDVGTVPTLVEGEATTVAVTITGVPFELEVTTRLGIGVELVGGADDVKESIDVVDDTNEEEDVEGTEADCVGNKALVTPPTMDPRPSGSFSALAGV